MKIYFSPLACSLATRITLYEAGAEATLIEVDPKTKHTSDGSDFRTVSPLGLVPALVTEDGELLTENAAILQYLTELYPQLQPRASDALERARLKQWLSFIGTELHKALYVPLLDHKAPEVVKQYALQKMESRLTLVAQRLEGREFLLDGFSVADAYMFAVLNWSSVTPVSLAGYRSIVEYQARLRDRASVARAFAEERELYSRELARQRAGG
jgi:glutathione S-transferase